MIEPLLDCCHIGYLPHDAAFRIHELDQGKVVAYSDTYACEAHLGAMIGSIVGRVGRVTTSWLVTVVEVA